jgi:hypothetical protein
MQAEMLASDRLGRTVSWGIAAVRLVLILLAFDLYLTYVLGLFPWTRAISLKLLDYAFAPVRAVGSALAGYLPKLFFVLVIGAVVHVAIRLVGALFRQIQDGRLVLANFPAEWADPTNKIARLLLIAFGLVVAFPYLPASDSPAFAGRVGVHRRARVAGLELRALEHDRRHRPHLHRRVPARRSGEGRRRVRRHHRNVAAGHAHPDDQERGDHDPNGIALGSGQTNYTREAATRGLILHTTVTIGYDAPWRTDPRLLIEAALATPAFCGAAAIRVADGPERFLRQLRDQRLHRVTARHDRHLCRASLGDPGRVLRRRGRDHVAALHVHSRRQYRGESPRCSVHPGTRRGFRFDETFGEDDQDLTFAPSIRTVPVTGAENPKIT